MRTRHRIPSLFNLSMVDVLCCALGCVILLWLLNLRDAKDRAAAAETASAELAATKTDLDQWKQKAAENLDRFNAESKRAEAAEKGRDRLQAQLGDIQARIVGMDRDLAELRRQHEDTADRLERKTREQRATVAALADARRRNGALERLLRDKENLVQTTARAADDLAERLRGAEDQVKQLQSQSGLVASLREEVQGYREKFDKATTQVQALEKEIGDQKRDLAGSGRQLHDLEAANERLKLEVAARTRELADAGRRVEALRGERNGLLNQARQARAAADNRFAGISLTGRRVVFLVDMSGSMEMLDDRTAAPTKWQGVRETLAKLMKSLPELEKYQVILFSDRVSYPLGNETGWLDFGAGSTDRAEKALAAAKPRGNTDMYTAFEAAFRLRASGLDTIYLLSDGLPNIGPGLAAGSQNLKETERNEVLSNYVRKALRTVFNKPLPDRPKVRINAVGFFYESPDVGAFLWALAREHDGAFVGMSQP